MAKSERGTSRKSEKPRVFVGSSVESLPYAYAIQENLDPHDAYVKVWPQGVFNIGSYGLESLLQAVRTNDFGVFVFAPDDQAIIRNRKYKAVRDNVIFELGLFMGALGRERTFVVAPTGIGLHLPSDLLGWNVAHYDPSPDRNDPVSAVGVACNKIRMAIHQLGSFHSGAMMESVSSFAQIIQVSPPFKEAKDAGRPPRAVIRYGANAAISKGSTKHPKLNQGLKGRKALRIKPSTPKSMRTKPPSR